MEHTVDLLIRIMADGLVVPVVLIGAALMLWLPKSERVDKIARGIFTGLVALLLAKLMSLLYQEGERPFMILGVDPKAAYLNNPGFPSDHALLVFTIVFVAWASTKNKGWCAVLLALAVLVAIGRVAALVHTPLDVIGGFAAALLAATLVYGRSLYRAR